MTPPSAPEPWAGLLMEGDCKPLVRPTPPKFESARFELGEVLNPVLDDVLDERPAPPADGPTEAPPGMV